MKQLRFSTTKPMAFAGAINPPQDHNPLALPKEIGVLIEDKVKGRTAYIHGKAEILAGFDIPKFIDGNIGQLELPIDKQDIVMILPSGEYKCKSEYCNELGSSNCYLITLFEEPMALTKNHHE